MRAADSPSVRPGPSTHASARASARNRRASLRPAWPRASPPSAICWRTAAPLAPAQTILVATSAVRDAANGHDFCARVRAATGQDIRVLTGDEEANLIGAGLLCDPALANLHDFSTSSTPRWRQPRNASLAFSRAPHCAGDQPAARLRAPHVKIRIRTHPRHFPAEAHTAIVAHVKHTLAGNGFPFTLADASAVFAGGSVTTVRAIFAAQRGKEIRKISPCRDGC